MRRSQRTSAINANGKRVSDAYGEWRGERRSSRLGTNPDIVEGPSAKRARTEESVSSAPSDSMVIVSPTSTTTNGTASTTKNSAAAVKPTEIAMEQVAGKKKSKFWFYAVEPAPTPAGTVPTSSPHTSNGASTETAAEENGHQAVPSVEKLQINDPLGLFSNGNGEENTVGALSSSNA